MLSPQLRRQVLDLWKMFWSSGMTNPLTSIEQITYLLFIKRLESLDAERQRRGKRSIYARRRNCGLQHHRDDGVEIDQILPPGADEKEYRRCIGHGTCRWSYVRRGLTVPSAPISVISEEMPDITPHDHLTRFVFPWLRELERTLQETGNSDTTIGNRLEDAHFQLPREKTSILQSAIKTIDDLFKQVGARSANADIMGDIFEYLLSEIETSGKNGQFRTPRHIIRFMIELLNPRPGQRIIDPAAGTGGFLINSIQHILKQHTDPETVLLEWDGTPHRIYGGDLNVEKFFTGEFFTGYDNDRTMVRIGWMNMILHGIENPTILLRDSLDKNPDYDKDTNAYDIALANPPFTGSVDKDDLHEKRFPRNPRNAKEPITNKSELLFVWVLLDLLRVGGRAAVIVPEGILYGPTGAHKELRRQLLMEHRVEGVISLPAGAFQPYTGVKTSILVFQKVGGELSQGEPPTTEQVWFYDVAADGYTLDAKRDDKPEPNDLWDALEKWKTKDVDSIYYYRPEILDERWRLVDEVVVRMFPNLAREKDRLLGIHEMFPQLPRDPEEATESVVSKERPSIRSVFWSFLMKSAPDLPNTPLESRRVRDAFQKTLQPLTRLFSETIKQMLESGYEDFGRKALSPLLESVREEVLSKIAGENDDPIRDSFDADWENLVQHIVQSFAMLDGYNVKLRTAEVFKSVNALPESKSWFAPVRVFARRDDWTSDDGTVKGSHDEDANVRTEYLRDTELYNKDGTVKTEYLESACIEANDFNLSAGRYKPFTLAITDHKSPAVIIREIQEMEGRIQTALGTLLSMVEGAE